MRTHSKRLLATLALVIGTATTASAQDTLDLGSLIRLVTHGDTLIVTDSAGRQTRSRVLDPSAETLKRFLGAVAPDIREIAVERRDPVWNGALIGLAVAGTPWLITCAAHDWCYYNE